MRAMTRAAPWSGLWVAARRNSPRHVLFSAACRRRPSAFPAESGNTRAGARAGGHRRRARSAVAARRAEGGEPAALAQVSHGRLPSCARAGISPGREWIGEIPDGSWRPLPADPRLRRAAARRRSAAGRAGGTPAGPGFSGSAGARADHSRRIPRSKSRRSRRPGRRAARRADRRRLVRRRGRRALLLVETQAAGFDPDGQQQALAELDAAFGAAQRGARCSA